MENSKLRCESMGENASASDTEIRMEDLAIAAAQLGARIEGLDLAQVLEEVQTTIGNLSILAPGRDCHLHSNRLRLWALISSSPSFRKAIIDMEINEPLVDFMSSELQHLFTQSDARVLLAGCRRRAVKEGVALYDDASGRKSGYWTLIVQGSVRITRVEGPNKEQVYGLAEKGRFFGACAVWRESTLVGTSFKLGRQSSAAAFLGEEQQAATTQIVAAAGCVVMEVNSPPLREHTHIQHWRTHACASAVCVCVPCVRQCCMCVCSRDRFAGKTPTGRIPRFKTTPIPTPSLSSSPSPTDAAGALDNPIADGQPQHRGECSHGFNARVARPQHRDCLLGACARLPG
jgi:hypothetical protein